MATPARHSGAVRARLRALASADPRGFERAHPRARRLVACLGRAATGVRWYWTTLMGDHDYERYVLHLRRVHPEQQPESVREYWRSRHDAPVQARCC